ncbi:MAG: hypothetical protein JO180_05655, partial [Gemmatirosa sp.]|nr:hypothetical protein [Gemmatirosa sp.]
IRAIDYCPPVDLRFGEFLRAVITADVDLVPSDPWGYREAWIDAFARHGIYPPNVRSLAEDELRWQAPLPVIEPVVPLSFARLQFRGDPACAAGERELRRQAAMLGAMVAQHPDAFGVMPVGAGVDLPCVQSIRSARRIGPDGQVLFDLVAEVTQRRVVRDGDGAFEGYGGATVLIGPRGEVRYVIAKNIRNAGRLASQRAFVRDGGRAYWTPSADGWLVPAGALYRRLHEAR